MDSAITEVCFSQPSKELGTICHAIPYQLALTNNVTSEHDKKVLKLLDKIANWARDKRIVDIYKQKGGWEGWLQVELALLFAGMGGKVTREERIYDTGLGRLRMDLLFKPNPDDQLQYGIELKCQSSGQDELNANTFRDAFKQDLRKVAIGPLVPQEGQNTIMVVLGFGVSSQGLDKAQEALKTAKNSFYGMVPSEDDAPYRVSYADTVSGFTLFWAIADDREIYRNRLQG